MRGNLFCITVAVMVLAIVCNLHATRQPVIRTPRDAPTTGRYIVVLKDDLSKQDIKGVIDRTTKISKDIKVTGSTENVLKTFTATLPSKALDKVRTFSEVKYIEQEGIAIGATEGNIVTDDSLSDLWYLDRINQPYLPLDAKYYTPRQGEEGEGVDIYVLDTGIKYNHVEFGNRAKYAGYDPIDQFHSNKIDYIPLYGSDCSGHGTLVASLAAGKTYGTSKKATLQSVRVLDCDKTAPWSVVIDGLDYVSSVVLPRQQPAVVSLALSGGRSQTINTAITKLYNQGVLIVTSAGNDKYSACQYSPGSSSLVLTVGATRKDDHIYERSNYGRCVDILAPGESIIGASHYCKDCKTTPMNGTSLSTPIVCGIAANFLSREAFLKPNKLKQKIIEISYNGAIDFSTLSTRGQINTPNRLASQRCGGIISFKQNGSISIQSPNFPKNYPNNLECEWTFVAAKGYKVEIEFSFIMIELKYDNLKVCSETSCTPKTAEDELTGGYGELSCGYTSQSETLTLALTTDGTRQAPGFNATYKAVSTSNNLQACVISDSASALQLDVESSAEDNFFLISKNWVQVSDGRKQGLNVVIIDKITGEILTTKNFNTHTSSAEADDFATMIEAAYPGQIVIISVSGEATTHLNDRSRRAIMTLGSEEIEQFDSGSWALVGMKGSAPRSAIERRDNLSSVNLSTLLKLKQKRIFGTPITLKSAGFSSGNIASTVVNGEEIEIETRNEDHTGLNVIIFDESSGEILHSEVFNTHSSAPVRADVLPSQSFANLIESLPNKRIVAVTIKGEAIDRLTGRGKRACESIGSRFIRQVQSGGSWAILGEKGATIGSVPEAASNNKSVHVMGFIPWRENLTSLCKISVTTAGSGKSVGALLTVGDSVSTINSTSLRGITLAVVEEESCTIENTHRFDIHYTADNSAQLASVIQDVNLDIGRIVVATVWDEASSHLTEEAKLALERIGSEKIRKIGSGDAWAIIGRKGAYRGSVPEVFDVNTASVGAYLPLEVELEICNITVTSHGFYNRSPTSIVVGDCTYSTTWRRGITVAIIKQDTCAIDRVKSFDTYSSATASGELTSFVNAIPVRRRVIASVWDEASIQLSESAKVALKSIGSAQIRQLRFRDAWAIIGKKGTTRGSVPEGYSPRQPVGVVMISTSFIAFKDNLQHCDGKLYPLNCRTSK